jgi:hypothetical protein
VTEPETLMDHFQQETHPDQGHFAQSDSPGELSPQSVAEQLNSLLLSADASARRIVHEAEARARGQLAEADQRIRSMEAEATRLASWSQQTEGLVQALSSAVGEFRRDIEAIPQRISDALNPLASHVPVLVRQMEELMGALSTPSSAPAITHDPGAMVVEHSPESIVMEQSPEAMVSEHSVEGGWGEGWNESGNGAA